MKINLLYIWQYFDLPTWRNFYYQDFQNVIAFVLLSAFLTFIMLFVAYCLSLTFLKDKNQLSEYECGFEPFDNATRSPFDVHFYIIGILFLIFDVEIAILFPWAICLNTSFLCFGTGIFFIIVLILGYWYEWRIQTFNWSSFSTTRKNDYQLLTSPLLCSILSWKDITKATDLFFFQTWSFDQWYKTILGLIITYYLLFKIYNKLVSKYISTPFLFTNKTICLILLLDLSLNFLIGIFFMLPHMQHSAFSSFLIKCPISLSPGILFLELFFLFLWTWFFKFKTRAIKTHRKTYH